jgi:hypothetical protein
MVLFHWHARESVSIAAAAERGTYPAGFWRSLSEERASAWMSFLEQCKCIKCTRPRRGESTKRTDSPYCTRCYKELTTCAPGAPVSVCDIRETIDGVVRDTVVYALDWLADVDTCDETKGVRCSSCGGRLATAIPFGKHADKCVVHWGGKIRKICAICLHKTMRRYDLLAGSHTWISSGPSAQ